MEKENGQVQPQLYGTSYLFVRIALTGPQDARVRKYLDVTKRAYLEAGATHGAYQRKGVATALIREAERLAKEHDCTQIGLCVGSADNPDAPATRVDVL